METKAPFGRPGEAPPGTVDAARMTALINAVNGAPAPLAGEIGAVSAEADERTFARMCFRVGDLGLLAPSNDGREVSTPPSVSRIPNTAPWMRGLANMRGELVPVVDVAAAFGVVRPAGSPTYLLILGQGDSTIGLLIDGLPRLLHMSASERLPEPPVVPPMLADSVAAAYEHADRIWLDVELGVLFERLARDIALV